MRLPAQVSQSVINCVTHIQVIVHQELTETHNLKMLCANKYTYIKYLTELKSVDYCRHAKLKSCDVILAKPEGQFPLRWFRLLSQSQQVYVDSPNSPCFPNLQGLTKNSMWHFFVWTRHAISILPLVCLSPKHLKQNYKLCNYSNKLRAFVCNLTECALFWPPTLKTPPKPFWYFHTPFIIDDEHEASVRI